MNTISLIHENQTSLKQEQQLLINLAMRQAFHVMQLPLLELAEWMRMEIENNPVLEIDLANDPMKERLDETAQEKYTLRNKSQENLEKRRKEQEENRLTSHISLYEHLMNQAHLALETREDLNLAELVIGHLNEKGFLEASFEEIAPSAPLETMQRILETVQTFDPPGVGTRNLQECLLLQLKIKNQQHSLAAEIIAKHFDDLIHNRLPQIAKALQSPIKELIEVIHKQIAILDVNPGYQYCYQPTAALLPDVHLLCVEDTWRVSINTSFLPKFHVAPIYIQALEDHSLENEEESYLRRQISGGNWLRRIIDKRNHTLHQITEFVLKKQISFFNGQRGSLSPLTLKEAAEELGLNESTVARAVSNKFIACPQGTFPLKSFFKQGVQTSEGKSISNHSLREILANTIAQEDKQHPLSDEELSIHFRKIGIPCARRTIAKYRSSLSIPPAHKRRRWV